ncbi:hypothetical protein ABZ609_03455 [Streptomyces rubiginosohelvolus]|uniref:hypothetical protein n=1 Tax=Streptomyces rubiginosohelvolus TaxID=67362 RepID=UPI0033C0C73F
MTTQPERLHHLLDRARRGVILPAEGEALAQLVRVREERLALLENGARERSALLEEARDALEAAGINEAHGGDSWPRLVPAIEELAADRDRLATEAKILRARVNDQNAAADVAVSAVRLMNEAGAQRDRAEARIRELEAEVAHYEEVVVGDLNEANIGLQRQAARAEATVTRVRQAVDAGPVGSCCAHLIRAALNPPAR